MPEHDEKPLNQDPNTSAADTAGGATDADAAPDPMAAEDAIGTDGAQSQAAEALVQLTEERDDLKERLMRSLAELENLRRRTQREKEDMARYSVSNFARDMLDVADNLGRALDSIPENDDELMRAISDGVRMTERVLATTLERHGVKGIDAQDQPFDPNLHQAMFEIDNPSVPAGTVLQVMQKGYVIHDRLLRPAMVGVSKGGSKPAPSPVAAADSAAGDPSDPGAGSGN